MAIVGFAPDWLDRDAVIAAGLAGRALCQAARHHCWNNGTDGHIRAAALPLIAMRAGVDDAPALAARLIDLGLWDIGDDGYYDTGYLDDNPTARQYEAFRVSRVANGRKGGRPRKPSPPSPDSQPDNLLGSDNLRGFDAPEPTENLDQNLVANLVGYRENLGANLVGFADPPSPPHTPPVPPVDIRDRQSVRAHAPAPVPAWEDHARAGTGTGAGARAGDRGTGVAGTGGGDESRESWQRRTYRDFVASYPKGVPKAVAAQWPALCPDEATWAQIAAGLAGWAACRQWQADGSDYVTAPLTFLAEKRYLSWPPPWDGHHHAPRGMNGHATPRHSPAGGDTRQRIFAGDNSDPYWAANHGIYGDIEYLAASLEGSDDAEDRDYARQLRERQRAGGGRYSSAGAT